MYVQVAADQITGFPICFSVGLNRLSLSAYSIQCCVLTVQMNVNVHSGCAELAYQFFPSLLVHSAVCVPPATARVHVGTNQSYQSISSRLSARSRPSNSKKTGSIVA